MATFLRYLSYLLVGLGTVYLLAVDSATGIRCLALGICIYLASDFIKGRQIKTSDEPS